MKARKAAPPGFGDYPSGAERPLPWVAQLHFRGGKSVHLDLRFSQGDFLTGFTVAVQLPGLGIAALNDMKTASLKAAEAGIEAQRGRFKIDPLSGEFRRRRTAAGIERPTELISFFKASQPLDWLKVEGVAPPGKVGATANLPGVFWIMDRGTYVPGARKPSIWEVFIEGSGEGRFDGRYFWRPIRLARSEKQILPPSEEQDTPGLTLLLIRPDDQTPNVLSESSRIDRPWIPPRGWSALPSSLREKVPSSLRYWTRADEKDRMRLRDELQGRWKEDGTIEAPGRGGAVEKSRRGIELNAGKLLRNVVTTLPDLRRALRRFAGGAA